MRKILVLCAVLGFYLFVFESAAFSQTSTDAKRLKEVEAKIQELQLQIIPELTTLRSLQVKYTSDYILVKEQKQKVEALEAELSPLFAERKLLQEKIFVENLPNSQIELLKIIVVQNRRIIELLELPKP